MRLLDLVFALSVWVGLVCLCVLGFVLDVWFVIVCYCRFVWVGCLGCLLVIVAGWFGFGLGGVVRFCGVLAVWVWLIGGIVMIKI